MSASHAAAASITMNAIQIIKITYKMPLTAVNSCSNMVTRASNQPVKTSAENRLMTAKVAPVVTIRYRGRRMLGPRQKACETRKVSTNRIRGHFNTLQEDTGAWQSG